MHADTVSGGAPGSARPVPPWRAATLAVAAGRPTGPGDPLNTPLVPASTFRDGGEVGYGRDGTPTWAAFERAVAALEGAPDAVSFASGQAATAGVIRAALGMPRPTARDAASDRPPRVLAPAVGYLGTRALLRDLDAAGVLRAELVDVADTEAVRAALAREPARLVWLESPTNPLLDLADLAALAGAAHDADPRALVVVDNTFATPLGQQPLRLGADVVVHSATKFLGGHSDLLLGVVAAADPAVNDRVRAHRHDEGAVPGVFEAFLALRGLRTLDVRLTRAQASAAELARRLAGQPAVTRVRYPGCGALLCLETASAAVSRAVLAAVRLVVPATSLGGVESTLDLRSRWPGEEHVPPSLLRLSVGCEDVEDLWADLDAALRAAVGAA